MDKIPLAEILKLTVAERLQLIERIWDSITAGPEPIPLYGGNGHLCVLGGAVCAEEFPGKVSDGAAVPMHYHAGVLRYGGNYISLKVFPAGRGDEGVGIFRGHHHSHASTVGCVSGRRRRRDP